MNSYDRIIIGSSPALLIDALKTCQLGKRVLIIEKSSKFGGSWASDNIFGYNCDNGPHLFYNFNSDIRSVFQQWSDDFGVTFDKVSNRPRAEKTSFWFDAPEHSFVPDASKLKFGKLSYLPIIIRYFFNLLLRKWFEKDRLEYLAPRHGTHALINKMVDKLKSLGVDFVSQTLVETINISNNCVEIICRNKKNYTAQSVLATSRLENTSIFFNNQLIEYRQINSKLIQLYFLIKDSLPPLFSYVRFTPNPKYFLCANITDTCPIKPPDNLQIIGLSLSKQNNLAEWNESEIKNDLIKYKLFSENVVVLKSDKRHFVEYQIYHEDVKKINQLSDRFQIYFYDNLMRGVIERYNFYK